MKVLCVAEKPSIAKAIAQSLGGGRVTTRHVMNNQYVKNYDIDYNFQQWGPCQVTVTSVLGHLRTVDFDPKRYGWNLIEPDELLELRIKPDDTVPNDMIPVARNIESEARGSDKLFIWTDCDREGEYIGAEIIKVAKKGNLRLADPDIKRAIFNNTAHGHLKDAANRPVDLDRRQVEAVETRIELDLRIGAAYTRFQTKLLKGLPHLQDIKVISYGPCQFPTLGFVVDRYRRAKNFRPESFWYIEVKHKREGKTITFNWERHRYFQRISALALFERCIEQSYSARVVKVDVKPTFKRKPYPLTTVELQKQGSKFLKMTPKKILDLAEKLYNNGYISYPRTETNRFAPEINLHNLIAKQRGNDKWGDYVEKLQDGDQFSLPRGGSKDDKAHPPIHPVNSIPSALPQDQKAVYEFITRNFLACCGKDAVGEQTKVTIDWAGERFTATGLRVIARNFLEVLPLKWETNELCEFRQAEMITLSDANLIEGRTTQPSLITEPELIAAMDVNGIGTDATMADHIETILSRQYATKLDGPEPKKIAPTALGMALVESYDEMNFDLSLSKPFMRKDTEVKLKQICEGQTTKRQVLRELLQLYHDTYQLANRNKQQLLANTRRLLNG